MRLNVPPSVKRGLRRVAAEMSGLLSPDLLRSCAGLPRVGKFAEAAWLNNNPFIRPIPPEGVLLSWAEATGDVRDMPPAQDIPCRVQYSSHNDWTGQKAALLAHWDENAHIAPYVAYYAAGLQALGYRTVLASDRALHLTPDSLQHIDAVVCRTCPGYDFTSWRAAFSAIPTLYDADELLVTNDSLFAPVGDLQPLMRSMDNVPCDFWGVLESHAVAPHLQSYWLVFRKTAIRHPAFRMFWNTVPASSAKGSAVNQEMRLARWLLNHGLRGGARFAQSLFTPSSLNPSHYAWDSLLQSGFFPFIKRELIFDNPYALSLKKLRAALADFKYPSNFIEEYAKSRKIATFCPVP